MNEGDRMIAVAGAGSIGCYAGGCLMLAVRKVVLLARPRIEESLRKAGLRVRARVEALLPARRQPKEVAAAILVH